MSQDRRAARSFALRLTTCSGCMAVALPNATAMKSTTLPLLTSRPHMLPQSHTTSSTTIESLAMIRTNGHVYLGARIACGAQISSLLSCRLRRCL